MKSTDISRLDRQSPWKVFFKDEVEVLSKPISEICNLSTSHGIFSNACEAAKLKSFFKKGKEIDPCNYTPISLLLVIEKIIEKAVHDQTNGFFSDF